MRFHETKHTGISALLEAGYSVPEVCKISGNSYRTIAHYAHVNEQRVFEKWKAFEYARRRQRAANRTAAVQQKEAKTGPNRASEGTKGHQGENANQHPNRDEFFTSDGGEFIAGWSSLVARRSITHPR